MTWLAGAQPLTAAPVAAPTRPSLQRVLPRRQSRPKHCAAAGNEEGGGAGPSGRPALEDLPSLPPLKQMSYRAIAGLAAAGLADSAYLTAVKLLHLTPACPLTGGGCGGILNSEYSTLFGVVPLSAVGMLAYGGMAALAWAGWRHCSSGNGGGGELAETPYRTGVLAGSLAMASCSSFLVYLLFTKFAGELCPWCLGSAAISFSIAGLAVSGLRRTELTDAAMPGAGVVATTLLLLSLGLGTPYGSFAAGGYDLDYALPPVNTQSSPKSVSLAQRLRDGGAKMYGAFWCSHCNDQKQAFGQEAMAAFPYVECYPEGLHKDTKLAAVCQDAPGGLQGFPTWVIGGEQLVGEQTFEQLEAALAKLEAAAAVQAAS